LTTREWAIRCDCTRGPCFGRLVGDIDVSDKCDACRRNSISVGSDYMNDTRVKGTEF
jgi:hypothetical protein